ncbi:N-acetylneuraminate synthase [Trichlorobacter lovleyi]|uniref:N-acylneuraminate-9-phosphate synthase n=1 Tax=Trichlorobacter lovleyi (strain ATCC BAA-1151 / DSM 17278 / SZ) TaxID=398767 RepID=B3E207_TRIL1|nr:N-acetylneuraminate synthase [Trichlorobacter lovleyi]ACD97110.1 N-acylneuraminate-9-phosphate synthase [Trichlorobacter lovleyi SZ]
MIYQKIESDVSMPKIQFSEGNNIYLIAEAGVNHNGSMQLAKKLVEAAKQAGADCVKFQTFQAENVVTRTAPKAKYQLAVTDKQESQLEMLKKLELSFEDHKELMDYCRRLEIDFLSTPYGFSDIASLEELGVASYKIASGQIVEPSFLHAVAATGKPIYLSTGMATLAEVATAVEAIRNAGNHQLVLLQCTTNYPSRIQDANLLTIPVMKAAFGTEVGYSDHTQSDTACLVAIGLGARVIEKHLTLDKSLPGPDHAASATPVEFQRLCCAIRDAEESLGSGVKEPCEAEVLNAVNMRRSLVAARHIKAGEVFELGMLAFKRPGRGIRPALLSEILGCVATNDIEQDTMITWTMCGERR